jgi:hypothetical protein
VVGTERSVDSMPVDDVSALTVEMEKEIKDGVHKMKKLNKDSQQ